MQMTYLLIHKDFKGQLQKAVDTVNTGVGKLWEQKVTIETSEDLKDKKYFNMLIQYDRAEQLFWIGYFFRKYIPVGEYKTSKIEPTY